MPRGCAIIPRKGIVRRLRRGRSGLQVRHRLAPEAIRHVLDCPWRQRYHRPALLPHQWKVRGLLGAGSGGLINPLFSLLRRAPVSFPDQSGLPVSTGSVTLILRLYDTPTGGKVVWEETQANVPVTAGRFSILLGSRTPLDLRRFGSTQYLGITIDDGKANTVDVEMRPRQVLVPVPWAYKSSDSDQLAGHQWRDLLEGGSND